MSYSVRDYISAAMLKTDTDCEVSSSYLSEHVPAVGVPVQGQVLVQDPQSMLFKDGCDVHSALHRGDGLVEDGVHKDQPSSEVVPAGQKKNGASVQTNK